MLVKRSERAVGGACPISAALSALVLLSKRVCINWRMLIDLEQGELPICLGISQFA